MAEIEVLQPGLFSSIQDQGRFGFRKYGVPVSGPMDGEAATMANLILQNDKKDGLLEITLQGPKMKFSGATQIVICGAQLSPVLDGVELQNNRRHNVEHGQVLSFGRRTAGCRAYLGVKGGFNSEKILGSLSWCPGITKYTRLEKGMRLLYPETGIKHSENYSAVRFQEEKTSDELLAFPGPEYDLLSTSEKNKLQKSPFSIGKDSNRMGIQMEESFRNELKPIITGPVLPGSVQLTPSGRLIVLMRDCQTTGGYPRVLQLSDAGINRLAQRIPGEKIRFQLLM